MANEINREFRQVDKFSSSSPSLFNRVYLTDTWLIKVSLYTVDVSRQDESMELVLTDSTELDLNVHNAPATQFLTIVVKPRQLEPPPRRLFDEFRIRLNSLEYKDFVDKLSQQQQAVRHACDVVIKQSLPEQFLDAFKRQLALNNTYQMKLSVCYVDTPTTTI